MPDYKKIALAPAALIAALAFGPAALADDAPAAPKPAAAAAQPDAKPAVAAAQREAPAEAAGQPNPKAQRWSFSGVFGGFDQAQLQRGFKVYKEVCSNCHALSIPFRTLTQSDGPGFSEEQVKALAATYKVTNATPNDKGEIYQRPGLASDNFPPPDGYPNPEAAAATFGKAPPDMALLAKARKYERGFPQFIFDALPFVQYQEGGSDYLYAILTGYTNKDDLNWNLYYPGHKIAMPEPPIGDDAVKYTDGTPAKHDNYARDVTAFLSWAAEPTLVERKRIGLRVMIFLIVFASLLYFTKKKIWADLH